jgi:hypothetical protein
LSACNTFGISQSILVLKNIIEKDVM